MALPDLDSGVGHSFGLEFDGVQIKSITEVSGLKMEQDVIELKENGADGKYLIKKLPGRWKAAEVTLTRGLTADTSFEKWIKDSQFGKMDDVRKGGADHRLRLRGQPAQALQADQRLAQEPGDRLAQGGRHQRPDREARPDLRAARGGVMRRSATPLGVMDRPEQAPAGDADAARPDDATSRAAHRVHLHASPRVRRRIRHRAPRRGHAAGDGRDELVPLRDDRVRENPAYLTVVLLGRVVTRIGTVQDVHAGIIEDLFATDLAFLQDLYRRINSEGHTHAAVTCPECSYEFAVDIAGGRLGES